MREEKGTNLMEVVGYLDKLSVVAGDRLQVKVSTRADAFRADIVRFDRAFHTPQPERDRVVVSAANGSYPARHQEIAIGSYIRVPALDNADLSKGLTFQCWLNPALLPHDAEQCVFSRWDRNGHSGIRLALDKSGHVVCVLGEPGGMFETLRSAEPLIAGRWYFIALRANPKACSVTLDVIMERRRWLSEQRESVQFSSEVQEYTVPAPFVLGASAIALRGALPPMPEGCLNGKIDRPRFWSAALLDDELEHLHRGVDPLEIRSEEILGVWDFSQRVSTDDIVDKSPHAHRGVALNLPTRALIGANWDGSVTSYPLAPEQYGAIAFHEDDLENCQWETDFVVDIPTDWSSGVYAVRLQVNDSYDYVPFYLKAIPGSARARVLFLAPTNTYLAYGNEKQFRVAFTNPEFMEKSTDYEFEITELDHFLLNHPELGASAYDVHPDGTGICYSSRLRPVLTMRPNYLHWLHGQARHFAADLLLIEWLETEGIAYDVATDEDLHLHTSDVLDPYEVVLTGSHPEYWTSRMVSGLEAYLASGGRLMYLGGNGFYWVTGIDCGRSHVVEIRRGVNGTRPWTSHPAEVVLSTTGEEGGIWRNRGLPPNSLVGVGFASEGWGGAPGYARTPQSMDPEAEFVFRGIAEDEVIGDFGLIMNGAAGDEIDRWDPEHGTPSETLRLATTELKHTDYYQLVIEDCSYTIPGRGGTEEPRVRSDIVLLKDSNGGEVFSTGSINWIGSLMWNDGDNNVSRVTGNVLRAFAGLSD